jgi:hypothetical protein
LLVEEASQAEKCGHPFPLTIVFVERKVCFDLFTCYVYYEAQIPTWTLDTTRTHVSYECPCFVVCVVSYAHLSSHLYVNIQEVESG